MALTNKQKDWILKNSGKYSSKRIADELNISEDLIKEFLNIQKKKKTPFYFYLILIFLPILFFVLLELGLRLFGYGFNYEQWEVAAEGKLMLNQEIAKRYFYETTTIPMSDYLGMVLIMSNGKLRLKVN